MYRCKGLTLPSYYIQPPCALTSFFDLQILQWSCSCLFLPSLSPSQTQRSELRQRGGLPPRLMFGPRSMTPDQRFTSPRPPSSLSSSPHAFRTRSTNRRLALQHPSSAPRKSKQRNTRSLRRPSHQPQSQLSTSEWVRHVAAPLRRGLASQSGSKRHKPRGGSSAHRSPARPKHKNLIVSLGVGLVDVGSGAAMTGEADTQAGCIIDFYVRTPGGGSSAGGSGQRAAREAPRWSTRTQSSYDKPEGVLDDSNRGFPLVYSFCYIPLQGTRASTRSTPSSSETSIAAPCYTLLLCGGDTIAAI